MPENLGFGLGLRPDHYEAILADRPRIDFFEALTENYLVPGGKPLYFLDRIRAEYPLVLHGVSLSIGSTEPLNTSYLELDWRRWSESARFDANSAHGVCVGAPGGTRAGGSGSNRSANPVGECIQLRRLSIL